MLTNEDIKSVVEGAFFPLRCGVEIWDYQDKLRFRVFGPGGKPLINFPKLVLRHVRSEKSLASIIGQVRERIEARGHTLDPWHLSQQ